MIDIHAHLRINKDTSNLQELLADTQRYGITRRYISTYDGDSIQHGNQVVADLVNSHKNILAACAVINPSLTTAVDDIRAVIANREIKMIEMDSFRHGYYPDDTQGVFDVLNIIKDSDIVVKVFTGLGAKSMPQQWEVVAKKFPTVDFIFLHMGCFDYGYGCIDVVARNKNIYTETSNQYEMQILSKAFHNLDSSKILFGTTYPARLTRSGIEIFDMFDIDANNLDNIIQNNALKLFK